MNSVEAVRSGIDGIFVIREMQTALRAGRKLKDLRDIARA